MFTRWGSLVHRRRWLVIMTILLLAGIGGVFGAGLFDRLSQGGYEDPGSESARAARTVDGALGRQTGDVVVVYTAPPGTTVDDPVLAAKVNDRLNALPATAVSRVVSYWRTPAPQLADQARHRGLAVITLTAGDDSNRQLAAYRLIQDRLSVDGVRSQVGGFVPTANAVNERSSSDLRRAEVVSLPLVLILLVIIFGGLVAASLPVTVGGLTILGSLGVLRLLSEFVDVNSFAVNVASLLGLGLAIDYGLFTVGRFREELTAGRHPGDAVRHTVATAGRTVAFSATLLIIALAGLLLFPQGFLKSVAYGGMAAVGIAAIVSLTLLPAVLAALGHRVDKLAVPWRREGRDLPAAEEGRRWRRLATGVMRRPVLVAVPVVAVLILLGAPFLGVSFGEVTEKALPVADSSRQAAEVLSRDFPSAGNDAAQVVLRDVAGGTAADQTTVAHFAAKLRRVPGVTDVRPAGAGGSVVLMRATLAGDPVGAGARDAVRALRAVAGPAGTEVLVGGRTARVSDSLTAIGDRLPLMVGVLVAATLLLLFLAFGSVLLPIKAVVMSGLSLSATFGVLVWLFQDGHGASLLGITPGPLEAGVVVLIAAVVFGLSTDYEVFLLSRVVEAHGQGASTEESVGTGVARTGGVISAAAVLLVVVTGAFAFSDVAIMRFVGVGMILALVLDATVVRMLLVPAVLKLLGDAAWWAPGPLRRLRQRLGVHEGGEPEELAARERTPQPVG